MIRNDIVISVDSSYTNTLLSILYFWRYQCDLFSDFPLQARTYIILVIVRIFESLVETKNRFFQSQTFVK